MKIPLILAHGTEFLLVALAGLGLLYGAAALSCWFALKKKKVAALVVGIPTFGLVVTLAVFGGGIIVGPAIVISGAGLWLAIRIKKQPKQTPPE